LIDKHECIKASIFGKFTQKYEEKKMPQCLFILLFIDDEDGKEIQIKDQ